MGRFIVFDRDTADAVRERTGMEPELRQEAMRATKFLDLVVGAESSVAVMPGERPGSAIVMRVARNKHQQQTADVRQMDTPTSGSQHHAHERDHLAPAGFLGLSDSVDMDTEPEKPKKWWQKLLD